MKKNTSKVMTPKLAAAAAKTAEARKDFSFFIGNGLDRLEFHDDEVRYDQVCSKPDFELHASIH